MIFRTPADPVLAGFYRRTLLEDVVPFWFPRCVDESHGGFLHSLDANGSVVDTDKSVWAQARMSWMLLTLHATLEPRPEWLAWAEQGIGFLERHCFDQDGRMFFQVARDGTPLRKRRYAFSECFTAIAYAAHARVTGRDRSATRAHELLEQFVDWNFTPGKMPGKWMAARPMIGLSPLMMTLVTAQQLRDCLGETARLNAWMDGSIDDILRLFCRSDIGCVMETVAPDGTLIDSWEGRQLNPGHAIEAAWFIMEEGHRRGDDALVEEGCRMLDWMWRRGWDDEHGGLFYYRDVHGRPVQEYWHDMKFWWPHDEAITATLLAWRLTGESRYRDWHRQVHDWSFRTFGDPQHGEWFGYAHRDGRLSNTLKGNLWKSFFHHPRMLLNGWQMAEGSEAA